MLGEYEWMCIICGFDNKPRSRHCLMCGTSYQFTMDYKVEKSEQKRIRKEIKKKKLADMNKVTISSEALLSDATSSDQPQTTEQKLQTPKKDNSYSFSANRGSLSEAKRIEAFNYRRLNQLSLRQKIARRRKMWQRKFDPETGQMVWIRMPASETIIGNAPFGYSPNNSVNYNFGISQSVPFSNSDVHTNILLMAAGASPPSGVSSRKYSSDSFGDGALISTSPGFTSYLDEEGGLQWERVEPKRNVSRPKLNELPSVIAAGGGSAAAAAGGGGGVASQKSKEIQALNALEDLESVAAMAFREKQLWFLNHMGKIQKPWAEGCVILDLHRENVLVESHNAIMSINNSNDLHKWIRIQFIGEPGIDAGGIEREWFGMVTRELFSPAIGLFTSGSENSTGGYHINPLSSIINKQHLSYFRFAGRIFGKAIMEQHSIPATLSLPIRKQILGLPITFSDLELVDLELYRNLTWLLENSNVESIGLDFTVSYEYNGTICNYDLVENGSMVQVTDENKEDYLMKRLRHRMLDSVKLQLENLLKGVYEVVPPTLLSVFDYQELDLLLCGVPEIDVGDWIRHTEYLSEYHALGPRHKVFDS